MTQKILGEKFSHSLFLAWNDTSEEFFLAHVVFYNLLVNAAIERHT